MSSEQVVDADEISTQPPSPVNDPISPRSSVLTADEAWRIFFNEPVFSLERVIPYVSLMQDSLEDVIPGTGKTPLALIAENALGEKMNFAAEIFAGAVMKKGMSAFKNGSLAKMALESGNEHGALDAAIADPGLTTKMRDKNGVTLLVQAMIGGHLGIIDELTRKRQGESLIDPYHIDSMGNTALISYLRNTATIRVDVLDALSHGLIQAKSLSSEDAVTFRKFIESSNSFAKNATHILAERLAQGKNSDEEIIEAFRWLAGRIDINQPDRQDRTAFIDVCATGNVKVIQALESMGADVSWVTQKGITPLSTAVYNNKPEVVDCLFRLDSQKIKHSIESMTEDRIGEQLSIPLLAARQNSWESLIAYLEHCNLGIDTSSALKDLHTPLIYAVKNNEYSAVEALIKNGCDVNKTNVHDMSAMHYAALEFDNKEGVASKIFYTLLESGASLDIADINGKTPLDIVLNNGKFESSDNFFYYVNLSRIASKAFNGDKALTEKYIEASKHGVVVFSSVINDQHPLMVNATKWASEHAEKAKEDREAEIKQGYRELRQILMNTGTMSMGMYFAIEKVDYPLLNAAVEMIPPDYRYHAIGFTALTMALLQSTDFCFNMDEIKKINLAAKHFAQKIETKILKPIANALYNDTDGSKSMLGGIHRACSRIKDACVKLQMACKAFTRIMRQKNQDPKNANELLGQMDDKLIRDISRMSRQEFTKIHAEARLKTRQSASDKEP